MRSMVFGSSPSFLLPLSLRFSSLFFSIPPSLLSTLKERGSSLSIYLHGIKRKYPPYSPPYTPPQNFGGMSGFPPRIFSPFFRGYPTPLNFFPLFPRWHYFHGLYFVNPKSPVCACDVGISLSNSHSLLNSAWPRASTRTHTRYRLFIEWNIATGVREIVLWKIILLYERYSYR